MTHLPNLDVLDTDGSIRDAAEGAGLDRSAFLKKGALAGGGLLAGGALFGPILSSAEARISTRNLSPRNDIKILNFALTLEFLEAEFYKRAEANKAYGANAQLKRFTEVVADHEARHVSFLRGALGSKAIKKPKFDFEDTGVRAYLGQVANISQPAVLKAAGTIATVEARHAAWIRFINNPAGAMTSTSDLPAPRTFDQRRSEKATLKAVADTGFIQS